MTDGNVKIIDNIPVAKARELFEQGVKSTQDPLIAELKRKAWEKSTGVQGLLSVGRNGEFAHILMEDVFWRTRWKVSEYLRNIAKAGVQ